MLCYYCFENIFMIKKTGQLTHRTCLHTRAHTHAQTHTLYIYQLNICPGLYRNTVEGIWHGHSHHRSICCHHQHSQRKGLNQCSTGIPYHHCRVAAEFLLEWRQDIRGADCLPGDSQSTRPGGYDDILHFLHK